MVKYLTFDSITVSSFNCKEELNQLLEDLDAQGKELVTWQICPGTAVGMGTLQFRVLYTYRSKEA